MLDSKITDARDIAIQLIDDPRSPMRSDVDMDGVRELADSIRAVGLINPISVVARGERFEVVAGHRRLLACRLIGLATVPSVVRELDDAGVVAVMATENLERSDVGLVDEAILVGRFVGEDESKIPELAKRISRSVGWVRSRLAILDYPDELIAAIGRGEIKLGAAQHLGAITDERIRSMFIRDAAAHGWSTMQAEYQFKLWESGAFEQIDNPPPPPEGMPPQEVVHARAICAKCGMLAVDPNLQSVFIHRECPEVATPPSKEDGS
ncbi:MAG: ParB/RepB/Spo0J family partition protein [Minisyncoccia bacterium]